jgi:hypothetical protein
MIKLFFLLPILMCLIWWRYLKARGCNVKDGLKGFVYIISFNAIIIGFFTTMVVVTN